MLIYPDTKVYVLCPGNRRSETAELCHQLCSQFIRLNVETYMIYLPSTNGLDNKNPVEDAYRKYYVPYDTGVEDDAKNILIVPEIAASYLYFTQHTRRILWWNNVHSFFRNITLNLVDYFDEILTAPMPKIFSFNRFDNDIEHWAQSEYARQFLKLNGVPDERIYSVTDYIKQNFLDAAGKVDISAKKNIVAYRPIKGRDFTDVVKQVSEYEWLPVEKLTLDNVQKLFAEAKVYVDFGDFPSKDKLARAAAVLDCVIITGKRGAAANSIDINIPDEFKFDETINDATKVAKKIGRAMKYFKAEHAKQAEFREKILREKSAFARDIEMTCGIKPSDKIAVGIVHGCNDVGITLIDVLFNQDAELTPAFIIEDAKVEGENVAREQNRTYLNVSDGRRLQIISSNDAKFLYSEGRIGKFIILSNSDDEINFVKDKLDPAAEDIINIAFEGGDNG